MNIEPVSGRPGYATIDLGVVLDLPHLNFSLQREPGDGRFLGADGCWHPSAQFLSPQRLDDASGSTRFVVGPRVVNKVDEEEAVVLAIRGTEHRFQTVWPALPRSSGKSDAGDPFGEQPASSIDGVEDRNPKPSTPQAGQDNQGIPSPEGQPVQAQTQTQTVPESSPVPVTLGEGIGDFWRRYKLLIVSLFLALMAAAAAAGWYLTRVPEPPPPPPAPASPCSRDEYKRLRSDLGGLIAERGDLAKITDAAGRLFDSNCPEFAQDGLRGLQAAALRGSVVARLKIADAFDPRYFKPDRYTAVPSPNAGLAAEYYSQADQAGEQRGGDELRNLCADLRRQRAEESALPAPCRD